MKGCPTYCNPAVAHAYNLTNERVPLYNSWNTRTMFTFHDMQITKKTEKRKREDSSEVDSQKTPPIAVVGVRRKIIP
jgi:hypothetical protein